MTGRFPILFVSHGAPSVALESTPYSRALEDFGRRHRPTAVVIVSAHWEEGRPVRVSGAARHRTLHDFSGFPEPLYSIRYPAPGAPDLAAEIVARLDGSGIAAVLDPARPLDHGAWVPLRFLYPEADVPVVGVALPRPRSPRAVSHIGEALAGLRERGVLLVGSGGAVHNLSRVAFDRRDADSPAWARDFDRWLAERVGAGDLEGLLAWRERAPTPDLAHPTTEHLDPVFFAAGGADSSDHMETLHEGFDYGTVSMRTFSLG